MPPKPQTISLLTLSHRPLSVSILPPHLRYASSTPTAPKSKTSASATSQTSHQQTPQKTSPPTPSPNHQSSPPSSQSTSPTPSTLQTSTQQSPSSPSTQQQQPTPKVHKTQAQLDLELREKLEAISGEGGAAGLELEGGVPVAMKRGVRSNMFRVI